MSRGCIGGAESCERRKAPAVVRARGRAGRFTAPGANAVEWPDTPPALPTPPVCRSVAPSPAGRPHSPRATRGRLSLRNSPTGKRPAPCRAPPRSQYDIAASAQCVLPANLTSSDPTAGRRRTFLGWLQTTGHQNARTRYHLIAARRTKAERGDGTRYGFPSAGLRQGQRLSRPLDRLY